MWNITDEDFDRSRSPSDSYDDADLDRSMLQCANHSNDTLIAASRRNPWGDETYAELITAAIQHADGQRAELGQSRPPEFYFTCCSLQMVHGQSAALSRQIEGSWVAEQRAAQSVSAQVLQACGERSGRPEQLVDADARQGGTAPACPRWAACAAATAPTRHNGQQHKRKGDVLVIKPQNCSSKLTTFLVPMRAQT